MMKTIVIKKNEIREIQKIAQELCKEKGGDVREYYSEKERLYDAILQEKCGKKDVVFQLNGGDLLDKKTVEVYMPVHQPEGFTPEEYTRLFGELIPNTNTNNFFTDVDETSGKVHHYPENGGASMLAGASTYSERYKFLVTKGFTISSHIVVEVED